MQHKEPSNASFHLALGIMVSNPHSKFPTTYFG